MPDTQMNNRFLSLELVIGIRHENLLRLDTTQKHLLGYVHNCHPVSHCTTDRYVLLGNHRDSWVFGAVDPSSGTAAMMELSRVMGKLVKAGTLLMKCGG